MARRRKREVFIKLRSVGGPCARTLPDVVTTKTEEAGIKLVFLAASRSPGPSRAAESTARERVLKNSIHYSLVVFCKAQRRKQRGKT